MSKRMTKKVTEEREEREEREPSGKRAEKRVERGVGVVLPQVAQAAPQPLNKIVIAGREYPCRVTMGALVRFKRLTGHDVSEMDYGDMEELMAFVHSCVASACKADGVEFDLDMMEMADLISPEALTDFYTAMGGEEGEEEKGESAPESPESEKKRVRG